MVFSSGDVLTQLQTRGADEISNHKSNVMLRGGTHMRTINNNHNGNKDGVSQVEKGIDPLGCT